MVLLRLSERNLSELSKKNLFKAERKMFLAYVKQPPITDSQKLQQMDFCFSPPLESLQNSPRTIPGDSGNLFMARSIKMYYKSRTAFQAVLL